MKKMISMLTAAVMLACSAALPVSAEENIDAEIVTYSDAVPYSLYTTNAYNTLSISGTTAYCKSYATGIDSVTRITATQYLQLETGTDSWSAIASWSGVSNSNSFSLEKSKSGLDSGTYRLRTVFNVYCGNSSERVEAISGEWTIR